MTPTAWYGALTDHAYHAMRALTFNMLSSKFATRLMPSEGHHVMWKTDDFPNLALCIASAILECEEKLHDWDENCCYSSRCLMFTMPPQCAEVLYLSLSHRCYSSRGWQLVLACCRHSGTHDPLPLDSASSSIQASEGWRVRSGESRDTPLGIA